MNTSRQAGTGFGNGTGIMTDEIKTHPVQVNRYTRKPSHARTEVTLRAYEVYCHVYAPQEAMVTGGCRGGFSAGELIAFLYAHSFPKEEWRARTDEAFKGLSI
jgi:hypothetical protein